jgi:hypothetical protein
MHVVPDVQLSPQSRPSVPTHVRTSPPPQGSEQVVFWVDAWPDAIRWFAMKEPDAL